VKLSVVVTEDRAVVGDVGDRLEPKLLHYITNVMVSMAKRAISPNDLLAFLGWAINGVYERDFARLT
jgi:hypothetical protein